MSTYLILRECLEFRTAAGYQRHYRELQMQQTRTWTDIDHETSSSDWIEIEPLSIKSSIALK
jgi:hypothetical protein